jgi:hypothetical protein
MKFSKTDTVKAEAIVRIFETSKPFGDYAALAILNDGAGISYGISQFTHRSGSLLAVVEQYFRNGGQVARQVIDESVPMLRKATKRAIETLAKNAQFKKALRAAAITREMRDAQDHVAFEMYLKPAIKACEGSGFIHPLSLAVVYDSMIHGSWEKIRDRVRIASNRVGQPDEKKWITEYVRKRDAWLTANPRLAATRYRTRFFLNQIAISNWDVRLPLKVQGVTLTDSTIADATLQQPSLCSSVTADTHPHGQPNSSHASHPLPRVAPADRPIEAETAATYLDRIQEKVDNIAEKYDQVEEIVTTVIKRRDAAKSLWTTVVGAVSQAAWALFGLITGVPREVWLVVAVIAAALMLAYLYRQIALGKIREKQFGVPGSKFQVTEPKKKFGVPSSKLRVTEPD